MFLNELCCNLALVVILAARKGDGADPGPCHLLGRGLSWGQVVLPLQGWATFVWVTQSFWEVYHPRVPDAPLCVSGLPCRFSQLRP